MTAPTVRDSINELNDNWAQRVIVSPRRMDELMRRLTFAAAIENNKDAINWLWLLCWQPQQRRN